MAALNASRASRIFGIALVATLIGVGHATTAHASAPRLFDAAYRVLYTLYSPRLLATADLNGDGIADVVLAHSNGNVSVMLGDGAGSFGAPIGPFAAASNPNALACADLNGDGKPDIVVTSAAPSGVSVLLGSGDGSFGPRTVVAFDYPQGVAVGDITGDGVPDLAVPTQLNVSVLRGVGDGTFVYVAAYAVYEVLGAVALADLNGDGRLDIAAASFKNGKGVVAVRLANGTGGFGTVHDFGVGSVPVAIAVADLNHDNRPDLVVPSVGRYSDYIDDGGSVSVLLGSGLPGSFGTKTDYIPGTFPAAIATGDVNGDGERDVIAVGDAGAWTLLGHGDGTFATGANVAAGHGPTAIALVEDNGDSQLDAVVCCGSSTLSLLDGDGDGTFGSGRTVAISTEGRLGKTALADVDGDGKLDVVTPDDLGHRIAVLLGHGDATFGPAAYFPTMGWPMTVAIGDLNGDGIPDVVTGNYAAYGNVSVLLGTGAGAFGTHADISTGGTNTHAIALSDLDRDGRLDLIVGNSYNGSNTLWVLKGNGDGTFGPQTNYDIGTWWEESIAVGDLNDDGWPDVAVTHVGGVAVLLGAGDGTLSAPSHLSAEGSLPTCVAMGDVNQDGKLDLVETLDGGGAFVWVGNGDGGFTGPTTYSTGSYPYAIAIGDLDHDGVADLATADFGADLVTVRRGTGGGSFGPPTPYGVRSNPVSLAVADMDLDGQPDLVVTETGSSSVSVLINRNPNVAGVAVPRESRSVSFEVSPNPIHGIERVTFLVPTTSHVRLTVLDVQGRIVQRLVDSHYSAGRHTINWDVGAQRATAGMLFVRIEMNGASGVQRVVRVP